MSADINIIDVKSDGDSDSTILTVGGVTIGGVQRVQINPIGVNEIVTATITVLVTLGKTSENDSQ